MADDTVATITKGYTFSEETIELGVLMADGNPVPDAKIRIPLRRGQDRAQGHGRAQQKAAERETATQHRQQANKKSVIEEVASSSVFKQFVRSAGREIVRGLFGTALRK